MTRRVHLISGSTGIGAAAAERLAAAGDAVFIASRTRQHGEELVDRLTASGGEAGSVAADLTVEADADAAVAACVERFGCLATPMAERAASDPAIVSFARRKQPLTGGLIDPGDVAAAAAFLLGPMARAITGQVLAVDGGWSVTSASPDEPQGGAIK